MFIYFPKLFLFLVKKFPENQELLLMLNFQENKCWVFFSFVSDSEYNCVVNPMGITLFVLAFVSINLR